MTEDQKVRVLVVDHEPKLVSVFKEILARFGIEAIGLDNHSQALANYKPGYYNGLIIGIRITTIYGMELSLKVWQLDPNVYICFTSVTDLIELKPIMEKEFLSNPYSFVKLPIVTSDIINLVKTNFVRAKQRR